MNRLVWRLRSHLITCAYVDDQVNCTRRAANQRKAIRAGGTIYAPYIYCKGIRWPLCRVHAISQDARSSLIFRLLGTWPFEEVIA